MSNLRKIVNHFFKTKFSYLYSCGIRFIDKINNSLFTIDEKLISIEFDTFYLNKNKFSKFLITVEQFFIKNNIKFYPHFGKFIIPNRKFKDYFNQTKIKIYQDFRNNADPFNVFKIRLN